MRSRVVTLGIAAACIASAASAATAFRVGYTHTGAQQFGSTNAVRVVSDGIHFRIDRDIAPDEVVVFDSLVSNDGGKTVIALNSQNQTWYRNDPASVLVPASFLWLGMSPTSPVRDVQWSFRKSAEGVYAGKLSYWIEETIEGARLRIHCTGEVRVTTSTRWGRSLWPGPVLFRTGIASVDQRIAADDATIAGFPMTVEMTVSRAYEGGEPTRGTSALAVSGIENVDTAAAQFVAPAGYREQPPVVGAPGGPPAH